MSDEANPVIVTTARDLRAVVSDAVDRALSDRLPEAVRRATTKPFLTTDEVLDLTGWSARTLATKRASRRVEYCKEGGKIVYPTDALHRLLDEGRVPMRAKSDA